MASNMISTGNIWWMTPLQAFATLGAAINFGEWTVLSAIKCDGDDILTACRRWLRTPVASHHAHAPAS